MRYSFAIWRRAPPASDNSKLLPLGLLTPEWQIQHGCQSHVISHPIQVQGQSERAPTGSRSLETERSGSIFLPSFLLFPKLSCISGRRIRDAKLSFPTQDGTLKKYYFLPFTLILEKGLGFSSERD